jgi:acetyl-CoA/propionyl-CoA carboxylase biotin carboxyl carrier protein
MDLVREQFRIAAGLPISNLTPTVRGHSIEFRVNGEDPAAGFMPSPGRITRLTFPRGPGVRVDTGVRRGDVISGAFDSMIAKIIVTGSTRTEAIERSRRALGEAEVHGIPSVLPFHRAVLRAPEFVAADGNFGVFTTWIETDFAPVVLALGRSAPSDGGGQEEGTSRVIVEVGGKRLEVVLPAALAAAGRANARSGGPSRRGARRTETVKLASGKALSSPMQGTVVKVAVKEGAVVEEGDLIVVIEAMKMEQPLVAHRPGTVRNLAAEVGAGVAAGATICEIEPVE